MRVKAMGEVRIRPAVEADLEAINSIYNHYVRVSTCTYQTEVETEAQRTAWFAHHGPNHPVTVAELDGTVVGWGSLSPFRDRAAYARTVEDSLYVRHDMHRRGIGGRLLEDLIGRARALGHRTIIAAIDAEQEGSVRLHERYGFVKVAHMREVGSKFDRWLDVILMQFLPLQNLHCAGRTKTAGGTKTG